MTSHTVFPSEQPEPEPIPWQETGQDIHGRAVAAGGLRADDLVTIEGVQGPVQDFVRLGLLTRSANGAFAAPTAAPARPAPPVDLGPALDENTAFALDVMDQHGGGMERMAVAQAVLSGTEPDARSLNALATNLELEPDQARALIAATSEALTKQAARVLSEEVGPELAEKALHWLRDNAKDRLQDAFSHQLASRSAERYRGMGKAFLANLDRIDADAARRLLPRGATAQQARDGQLVVRLASGEEWSWSALALSGEINTKTKGNK